jgi:hypothetical protein
LVSGGPIESIARAYHERWRSDQISAGKSALPWEEVDESHANALP